MINTITKTALAPFTHGINSGVFATKLGISLKYPSSRYALVYPIKITIITSGVTNLIITVYIHFGEEIVQNKVLIRK